MTTSKTYIQTLFNAKSINIAANKDALFNQFVASNECESVVKSIVENQNKLIDMWRLRERISDIIAQQIIIPNATVGKVYTAIIDFKKLNLTDFIIEKFEGLEDTGITFNKLTDTIEGTPIKSGDLKFNLLFKIKGELETVPLNVKQITLIINPDPKTLWKDLPSDKEDIFWKEDDVSSVGTLGTKHIVVLSKRGRSHKNVGSFRDDDFACKHFEKSNWSIVAVSDGAGSAPLSRKGSELACNAVIDYFENHADIEKAKEFEEKLFQYNTSNDEQLLKEIEVIAKQNLYKATVFVHTKLKEFADETYSSKPELFNNPKAKSYLDYFHSTLIFTLFKKFDFGFVILTFGVGDCPIAVMNLDKTETTLLNWLDVGEFGGGTRFITQPDIFHSTERPMVSRFNFKIINDFSFLFLMSDGIYDPKFVVEANLEKHEKWVEFIEDLQGKNDENIKVVFDQNNTSIETQLSNWMDFWSTGNHDDRTLAIVF